LGHLSPLLRIVPYRFRARPPASVQAGLTCPLHIPSCSGLLDLNDYTQMLSSSGHCHVSLIVIWLGFPVSCSSFSYRSALVMGKIAWCLGIALGVFVYFSVSNCFLFASFGNISCLFINDSARSFLYNKTTPFNDLGSTHTLYVMVDGRIMIRSLHLMSLLFSNAVLA